MVANPQYMYMKHVEPSQCGTVKLIGMPEGRVPFVQIRTYVFLGATGTARRGKERRWVGFSGPVSNERYCYFVNLTAQAVYSIWSKYLVMSA